MTKLQFLHELNRLLAQLPETERNDILYDYELHIQSAMENGKTEEEAVLDLGSPQAIASDVLGAMSKESEGPVKELVERKPDSNMGRGIFVFSMILLFNLIFIVGPVAGIAGALIGFYVSAFALLISPIAFIIDIFTQEIPLTLAFFIVLATCSFGYLFFLLTHFLGKGFVNIMHRYWKFNVKLVKGGN
jgi:uncharacterized membrane protein